MGEWEGADVAQDRPRRAWRARVAAALDRRLVHVVAGVGIVPLLLLGSAVANVAPATPLVLTVGASMVAAALAAVVYARVLWLARSRREPGDHVTVMLMSLVSLPSYVIGLPLLWFSLGWANAEALR